MKTVMASMYGDDAEGAYDDYLQVAETVYDLWFFRDQMKRHGTISDGVVISDSEGTRLIVHRKFDPAEKNSEYRPGCIMFEFQIYESLPKLEEAYGAKVTFK